MIAAITRVLDVAGTLITHVGDVVLVTLFLVALASVVRECRFGYRTVNKARRVKSDRGHRLN